jgi:hypothetical protein
MISIIVAQERAQAMLAAARIKKKEWSKVRRTKKVSEM